ncbi:MAG: hypothetical protein JST91_06905 [Actinobacteria bacterium]|nr:hypothetical protein [Actinomycetota bacterium]
MQPEIVPDHAVPGLLAATPDSPSAVIPLITAMARAYTRGRGFDDDGRPNDEVAAVITTASARLAANTKQLNQSASMDGLGADTRSFFTGWTLAELFVLNRYRRRAM